MCTAIAFQTKDCYFGRNLDLEYSYQETVTITPRNFVFPFRKADTRKQHYAMIGMAYVSENYPLYYDAVNEKGLCMAGLNFPGNADYKPIAEGKDNISPFELIPWVLGQCATVKEARKLLEHLNLAAIPFSEALPLSPLHWILSDSKEALTIESVAEGLKIYENPVGVLTNNPEFDMQLFQLNRYMGLSAKPLTNQFSQELELQAYSRGMGAVGMPGDWSSSSRFVKAVFMKMNSLCGDSEEESVSQFFHLLDGVSHPRGCVDLGDGKFEITVYSSCCNADKGIYYYTTYENRQINGVDMRKEDLDGDTLISYPLLREHPLRIQNA